MTLTIEAPPAAAGSVEAGSAGAGGVPQLAARSIVRRFGAQTVLGGVDLVQEAPGVVGLVGPNGAGKTTLLRIVAQLLEADAGTLEICGRTVGRADDAVARRLVGWAPHAPLAWLDESVEHNLRYALRLAGAGRDQTGRHLELALREWDLCRVASAPVRRLSRGMQQRYGLARADLLQPRILLLDEPTTGLDEDARRLLEQAIEAWRQERVVVIASHEREWLEERCGTTVELASPAASG